MLFAPLFMGCDNHKQRHTLYVDKGIIRLDSNRFSIASVELGYSRQPREYWQASILKAKSMGANTIMVRVPWFLHEPTEGCYDFAGNNDIREYCRLINDAGLLVWLHVGPYSDPHADMGAMPWWLLKYDDMEPRSLDTLFMQRVGRFYRALGKELSDMQLSRNGPIAFVHIEEPHAMHHDMKNYLSALCDSVRGAGFDSALLTLAAYKDDLFKMPHDKAYVAIAMDDDEYAMRHFSGIRKINLDAPLICYDVSRTCALRWGFAPQKRNLNNTFLRLFEMFEKNISLNTSAVFGGTSFGHIAGAELDNGVFRPYATSYDNGTLFSENFAKNIEYDTYAKMFDTYATRLGGSVGDSVGHPSLVSLPQIRFTQYAPLSAVLPAPLESSRPLTMEQCNVGYGAMLYTAEPQGINGDVRISINGIHDNATLYHNDKQIASASRIKSDTLVANLHIADGDKISILVDAVGRVGNIPTYKDRKGIVSGVELSTADGVALPAVTWRNHPLPADYSFFSSASFGSLPSNNAPGIYRATFKKEKEGDTYLFVGTWGRGEVWVNGHSLGRFWNIGPQLMLYMPGCWLHDDNNELLVVDWVGPRTPVMEGLKFAPTY